MNNADRRTFFKIAGTGMVAAGGVALIPSAVAPVAGLAVAAPAAASGGVAPAAGSDHVHADGALVAFVGDVTRGEVVVMVEGREVVITDHAVVAALSRAVHATAAV